MTTATPARSRGLVDRLRDNRLALWIAFILAHLWLGFLNLNAPNLPLGDVTLDYQFWAKQADFQTFYVGIDSVWVYPIVALVPMVVVGAFGFQNYDGAWLSFIFVLDAIAFLALVGARAEGRRRSSILGWWWIAFLVLLGPIALGRIDSVTIPLAIIAVLFLASRPVLASVLLTIATWIKVWPAALIAAIVIASRARIRILLGALATSILIIGAALALGSGGNVFSFVTQQTGRGLQVEAPVSSIWMWEAFAHVPGAQVFYDTGILTYEVTGPGTAATAAVMTWIQALAFVVIAGLGIIAVRRGAQVGELLPALALALVTAFIAFNKVGSPQYMTWLSVPVILGLATHAMDRGRSFKFPALLVLSIAVLTQAFYPFLYNDLLALFPSEVLLLSMRNALLFVLLGWAVAAVVKQPRPMAVHEKLDDADPWLPAVWPFPAEAEE